MKSDPQRTIGAPFDGDRVVVVAGVGGVDRDHAVTPTILAPFEVRRSDPPRGQGRRRLFDSFRERVGDPVPRLDREHRRRGVPGRPEHALDAARRARTLFAPIRDLDDDEVAGLGSSPTARRDEYVDPELRPGRVEPAVRALAVEDADDVRVGPVEDLDDGSPGSAPSPVVDPHGDAVAVHGRAEIAGADEDVFIALVGNDEGRAALDPLQPSADSPATSRWAAAP